MCFLLTEGNELLIAQEDIICYKVFDNGPILENTLWGKKFRFISKYQAFEYKSDIVYTETRFNTDVKPFDFRSAYPKELNFGFHSYTTKKMALHDAGIYGKVFEFIIPKGSKYYVNDYHQEYISDTIKATKKEIETAD